MSATTAVGQGWAQSVVSDFDPDDVMQTALVQVAATKAGEIEGDTPTVIVPYVRTDPPAAVVAEDNTISTTDGEYDQIEISTSKVAVVTRISNEVANHPNAAARIARAVSRSVTTKADTNFTAALLAVDDVATAGDLGGTTDPNLFAAYDAVGAIEADGGQATHLLINPVDWATLCKLPTATGSNMSLLADVHDAAARALAGVPVIVHSAMPQGTALMLDRSEVVAAVGPLKLARSDDAFFTADAVAIRATFRSGVAVVRPTRLQKLTIAAD